MRNKFQWLSWLVIVALLVGVVPVSAQPASSKPVERSSTAAASTLPAAPAAASAWCVAGSFQSGGGWNNGSDPLYDDGTHGDLVAGDGIYSLDYSVAKAAG